MASLLTGIFRIILQLCSPPQRPEEEQVPPPHHQPVSQPQGPPRPYTQQHQPPQKPHESLKPHTPSPHGISPGHKPHKPYRNENLINQNDLHYKSLRAQAKQEGDAMAKCFDESHRAYQEGDGAKAKELSNQGHAHQKRMNELNAEASAWIFEANNTDSEPGEIDLHGLYVREAITYTESAIQDAQRRGANEIRLIVGKGLHSADHVAKLKPAIEDLIQKYNLVANLDEHNSGVLIVSLEGRRTDRVIGADDITRKLESKDEDCVIM